MMELDPITFEPVNPDSFSESEKGIANLIARQTQELQDLIMIVNDSLQVTMENGIVKTDMKLTIEEMELFAVKIPALCMVAQGRLNAFSAKNIASTLRVDMKSAEILQQYANDGIKLTVDEKKRTLDTLLENEKLQIHLAKAITKSIQETIERGDKVYEGIKKVMDFRAREGWFDRKMT